MIVERIISLPEINELLNKTQKSVDKKHSGKIIGFANSDGSFAMPVTAGSQVLGSVPVNERDFLAVLRCRYGMQSGSVEAKVRDDSGVVRRTVMAMNTNLFVLWQRNLLDEFNNGLTFKAIINGDTQHEVVLKYWAYCDAWGIVPRKKYG